MVGAAMRLALAQMDTVVGDLDGNRRLILVRCGAALIGPTVCEDVWQPGPPATDLAIAGAHVIANISASPFHVGKGREREEMLATRARDNACWIAFVNCVGAQDELIFD